MHEMSIAQSILDIVKEEMAKHQVEKLAAINIAVGALSAVVPSSLTFCYNVLVDKTEFAETRLNVRVVPLTYSCYACGHDFTSEEMTFECPACGEADPMLTAGRDLTIENIEVAETEKE
ncbi:MAG: hydrogenase maturation nickel metallochaperone HypA [Proteobacteria bacterium]|nr:hydrogenase maturation nickel metallochaperone HypA [Pseudomonadota bacterium]